MDVNKIKVLFVCTGNICRSPLAEGVFKQILKEEKISSLFVVDSAGTEDYHVGSPPDSRSVKIAKNNGLNDLNHKARQFIKSDFDKFDYILVMDHLNYDAVISKATNQEYHDKVMLFRTFDVELTDFYDVPDPYYGTEDDFAEVGEIVKRSGYGFISYLKQQGKIK